MPDQRPIHRRYHTRYLPCEHSQRSSESYEGLPDGGNQRTCQVLNSDGRWPVYTAVSYTHLDVYKRQTSTASESTTETQTDTASSEAAESTASNGDLEDFNIVLDWYPNAVHSFIYTAIEKGYYAEEGLNVHVQFPANTNDAITMTAAGQADAGLYYQPNIISTATNQDVPVKILGTIVQHPLNIVMSMKSSNITCAKDLKGKIIGYPGTVDNEYFVKAMMEHNGLSYDDVTMQDVGFDLNTSLISGNVDAVIGTYINHEYPALQKEGYDVTYFDITKEGCPDYEELVLVTGENQVKNESDKLAKFIRASRKGFQDVLDLSLIHISGYLSGRRSS